MTSSNNDAAAATHEEVQVANDDATGVVRSTRVTVSQSRVSKAFDSTYRQLSRTANVKGFRKGKVPRGVLEKLYGASIPEEIERLLVQETLEEAIGKSGLEPVVQPEVEAGSPAPDADFEYTLRIEVKPEIELPELDGLPATAPKVELDTAEVDAELERMRESNAPWVEVAEDVKVENGHTVTFDYKGSVDGEFFEGGTAEGVDLEIGAGRMIPGFEEGLVGAAAGEDVTLKVQFPADYGAENLAGKDAEFACTVHTIKAKVVPELDDEFAKDLGDDFDTLDQLRSKLGDDQIQRKERTATTAKQKTVMDSLLERTDFEVPPGIVERQLNNQLQQMAQQFQGQLPPDILQQQIGRMREEGRESAERRVRESFVLEAVIKAQSLEAGEEEIEARFNEMADAQGMDVKQVKEMAASQGWGAAIEAEVLDQKALDFLVSKATVEEEVAADPAE